MEGIPEMTTTTAGDTGNQIATTQLQTRLDRGCDRCGATFVDIAVLPDGSQLQFCGHHYNEHSEALNSAGAIWQFGYAKTGSLR
jgi:hypothetical protein